MYHVKWDLSLDDLERSNPVTEILIARDLCENVDAYPKVYVMVLIVLHAEGCSIKPQYIGWHMLPVTNMHAYFRDAHSCVCACAVQPVVSI